MFNNICKISNCIKYELIDKGWSNDKKYHIYNDDGKEYLLRISSIDLYEKKKKQFLILKELDKLDVNIPIAIDFGIYNVDSIYMLLSYVEGEPAEEVIKQIDNEDAYNVGVEASKILKKIHSVNTIDGFSWFENFKNKIIKKIKKINDISYSFKEKSLIIDYINNNIDRIKNRPTCITHGDFHIGNMVINRVNGKNILGIVDFDKLSIADPYDDFKPFCWNVYGNEYFETGLINGYFDNNIPNDFFLILSLYAAESLISQLPWAITFGQDEIDIAYKVINDTLLWFNKFNVDVPSWYKGVL